MQHLNGPTGGTPALRGKSLPHHVSSSAGSASRRGEQLQSRGRIAAAAAPAGKQERQQQQQQQWSSSPFGQLQHWGSNNGRPSSQQQPSLPALAPSTADSTAYALDRLFLQSPAVDEAQRPLRRSPAVEPSEAPGSSDEASYSPGISFTNGQQRSDAPHALKPGNVHVFCYGTNMSISTLHQRDVHQVSSRDAATVHDPAVRLVFKHRGGYATLATLPQGEVAKFRPFREKVHGVLYQLSRSDLKKLQSKEGGYQLSELKVETYAGEVVDAHVFVSSPLATLACEVAPTESYMRLLRQGAQDNYLDPEYQAFLSSISTVTSAGLPDDYFNTPARHMGLGVLALSLTGLAAFVLTHL